MPNLFSNNFLSVLPWSKNKQDKKDEKFKKTKQSDTGRNEEIVYVLSEVLPDYLNPIEKMFLVDYLQLPNIYIKELILPKLSSRIFQNSSSSLSVGQDKLNSSSIANWTILTLARSIRANLYPNLVYLDLSHNPETNPKIVSTFFSSLSYAKQKYLQMMENKRIQTTEILHISRKLEKLTEGKNEGSLKNDVNIQAEKINLEAKQNRLKLFEKKKYYVGYPKLLHLNMNGCELVGECLNILASSIRQGCFHQLEYLSMEDFHVSVNFRSKGSININVEDIEISSLSEIAEAVQGGYLPRLKHLYLGRRNMKFEQDFLSVSKHSNNITNAYKANTYMDQSIILQHEGIENLAKILSSLPELETLSLTGRWINDIALKELFQASILKLKSDLESNQNSISDTALNLDPGVASLSLSSVSSTSYNSNISSKVENEEDITYEHLYHVSNPLLQVLDLSKNNLGDRGMEVLGKALLVLPSLKKLNLSYNGITEKGVRFLFAPIQVKYNNTSYTNHERLPLRGLQNLDLRGNSIGEGGCKVLSRYLSLLLHNLTSLDLHANDIGNKGFEYLFKALSVNDALNSLHENVGIYADKKKKYKSKLKHLYISKNNITDCDLFVYIFEHYVNPLSYLNINACLQSSEVKSDPGNDIDYTYSDMENENENGIMDIHEKERLLWQNNQGKKDFHLACTKNNFNRLDNLNTLHIGYNKLDKQGTIKRALILTGIIFRVKELDMMNISENPIFCREFQLSNEELGMIPVNRHSFVGNTSNPNEDHGEIGAIRNVQFFMASHVTTNPDVFSLRLKILKLGRNNLSHSGVNTNQTYITKLVEYGLLETLEQLTINFCDLGDENIVRIAAHLSYGKCPNLRSIDCSGNNLTKQGTMAIAKGLKMGCIKSKTLKLQLNIDNNNLSKQVVRQIGEYLQQKEMPSKSSRISQGKVTLSSDSEMNFAPNPELNKATGA